MRTNQALIKKEVQVIGRKVLLPAWIVMAMYGMLIIGLFITFIIPTGAFSDAEGRKLTLEEIFQDIFPPDFAKHGDLLSYLTNYVAANMVSALIFLNLLILTPNILNVNKKENYELFHRTQPVSIWKMTGAKIIAMSVNNWLVFLAICIFNYIVINILFSILFRSYFSWNFGYGIIGLLHLAIPVLVILFIVNALAALLSSIFQDGAIGKGVGAFLGISIVISIINRVQGLRIPQPYKYFESLINISWIRMPETTGLFVLPGWQHLFNWNTLIHILVGIVYYILATYIYSKREIRM